MKVEYGPKCAELARWLLRTQAFRTEQDITALAKKIQRSIEDWLDDWDARPGGIPPQTVWRTPEWREQMGYLPPGARRAGAGEIFLGEDHRKAKATD